MPDRLPDAACVRLTAIAPALPEPAPLIAALGKLFDHFVREGRCAAHVAATACDGALLVLAWEGAPLSGCAHDRIARLLATWGGKGHDLLTAPPLVVRGRDGWQAVDRVGLRALVAAGAVDGGSLVADTRLQTLGEWRARGLMPLRFSWIAGLLSGPSLHRRPADDRSAPWPMVAPI